MLEFLHVKKSFKELQVIKDFTYSVENNKIVGLLGVNGAGKTTLIKMACGITDMDSGDIRAYGASIKDRGRKYAENVGAVLEGSRNIYWRLTPEENMKYFAKIRGVYNKGTKVIIDEILKSFNLWDKRDTECGKLSRGMQQKVALGCSLVCDFKVLFLDEPTLGMDIESIFTMEEIIKERVSKDRIVVITSHDLNFVDKLCENIVILNKGTIGFNSSLEEFKRMNNIINYHIRLNSSLKVSNLCLKSGGVMESMIKDQGHTDIKLTLNNEEDILDSLNELRSFGGHIISINREELSSEDIFRHIVEENHVKEEVRNVI